MGKRKTFTMTLDSDLMREAKKRAIDLGVPLYRFVEDAVEEALGHASDHPGLGQEDRSFQSPKQEAARRQR
jgi:hypothetical protein